ncbi:MAG TPA: SAVED domain-containing protein [Anaerolineae bacterium]|nr:SAVED domain-containing protein [Anaerolineae bacterium]HIQ06217.1 SAVED domain-containing protein [Anaerolineae bacterium]
MSWKVLEEIISWIANLIEIGSVIFVVLIFWRNSRRYARLVREGVSASGQPRPVALVIGVGADISGAVKAYLGEQGLSLPIENYYIRGFVPAKRFPHILRQLHEIKRRITAMGATEVHLFYRGPVTFSAALGAVLGNWVPVTIYAYEHGSYRPDFVLDKETVVGWPEQERQELLDVTLPVSRNEGS